MAKKEDKTTLEEVQAMEAENKKRLEAEEKDREKAVVKVETAKQKALDDEMKRPLSPAEREELRELEAMANKGRFQPDPPSMLRLGRLHKRAKLKE